jgi:hypothetical protein
LTARAALRFRNQRSTRKRTIKRVLSAFQENETRSPLEVKKDSRLILITLSFRARNLFSLAGDYKSVSQKREVCSIKNFALSRAVPPAVNPRQNPTNLRKSPIYG